MDTSLVVSAVLLCHNNEKILAKAVDSIQQQSYPIHELWILDDASNDRSFALANTFSKRVYQNPRWQGRGYMRYLSIEGSHTPFILSCDAGACLEQDFLKKGILHFKDETVGAVFGRMIDAEPSKSFVDSWRKRHLFHQYIKQIVSEKASLQTAAVIFRKSAVLAVGNFNKTYIQCEDKDLGERLLKAGWKVVYDPTILIRPNKRDTFFSILERYWRWNSPACMPLSLKTYARQVVYAFRVMVYEDLKNKEYGGVLLSLICPHYQFLKSWLYYLRHRFFRKPLL
jgi:GT2 family glycosyltransferase